MTTTKGDTMATKTDARTDLANKIAEVADAETTLVVDEYALDPIEDAVLIAQIAEGNRLKREAGRIKRERAKINAKVRAGIEAKGHTILTVSGEPVTELLTGVQRTTWDYDLLERLAPVAVAKSRTVTHDGETLLFK